MFDKPTVQKDINLISALHKKYFYYKILLAFILQKQKVIEGSNKYAN